MEVEMRTLLTTAMLSLTAAPAFAQTLPDAVSLPEPGVIGLIGIGIAAFLIGRHNKKK
jgi:hypothetical protein